MEKFAIGALLGMLGGALLVSNNYKMRALVKKSQQEVQDKFDEILDKKLGDMDEYSQPLEQEQKKKKK